MSQHIYPSSYKGLPITILMGWDRPLQGFFMVIELEEAEGLIYSNLDDPKLIPFGGLPDSLEHFSEKLDELGLSVPQAMIEQIELDAAANVGNRHVLYDQAGNVVAPGQ